MTNTHYALIEKEFPCYNLEFIQTHESVCKETLLFLRHTYKALEADDEEMYSLAEEKFYNKVERLDFFYDLEMALGM